MTANVRVCALVSATQRGTKKHSHGHFWKSGKKKSASNVTTEARRRKRGAILSSGVCVRVGVFGAALAVAAENEPIESAHSGQLAIGNCFTLAHIHNFNTQQSAEGPIAMHCSWIRVLT